MKYDVPSGYESLKDLVKFSEKYGLPLIKIECELYICEIKISIKDFGEAMILLTKTLASLETNHSSNLSFFNLYA